MLLLVIFVLALLPRLYAGMHFGADLDRPGHIRIINFDEAGSCRAILGDFSYSSFLGHQVLALARLLGHPPATVALSNLQARRYCYSQPLTRIHRTYSALSSAATVALVALIALMMWPKQARIAWSAAALLGLSNFHVAQAQFGTADAPQVFFLTFFSACLVYGLSACKRWPLWLSPLLMVFAVWAKWYVFAVFAYACLFRRCDFRRHAVVYGAGIAALALLLGAALAAGVFEDLFFRGRELLWGSETSRFGSGYGHIGSWRRWIRNAVNLPVVHIVGLGLPACLFVLLGVREALRDGGRRALWLVQAPAFVYALYLLVLAPVTYYRHYLPLFPTVALLAAYGFWQSRWASRWLAVAVFAIYPAALLADSMLNYRADPRYALRQWYAGQAQPTLLFSHYTMPPAGAVGSRLFDPDAYLRGGGSYLDSADYLVLSENWYDTSFPNELNGPIAWKPEWLVKTKPEYVRLYRRILAGEDANLEPELELNLAHVMPEFLLHRRLYGSFPLFLGDLRVFRVVR